MILVIDNYDSFVYNLVQYIGELKEKVIVYRNDAVNLEKIKTLSPDKIVISPGPGRPENAGISCDIVTTLGSRIPILGVCLGHQCIGYAFGGKIVKSKKLMHGKTSLIYHKKSPLYTNMKNPFTATRYHSLTLQRNSCPEVLDIEAWTKEEEIMGIRHKEHKIFGVQFHPESILTTEGKTLIRNFLDI
jgi:anthranilate synthase component II